MKCTDHQRARAENDRTAQIGTLATATNSGRNGGRVPIVPESQRSRDFNDEKAMYLTAARFW
jgi:hypothetical protein